MGTNTRLFQNNDGQCTPKFPTHIFISKGYRPDAVMSACDCKLSHDSSQNVPSDTRSKYFLHSIDHIKGA